VVWERWTKAVYFSEPKTAKSRRTVPLPPYVIRKLQEHRRHQLEHKLKTGEKFHNEHNLIFTSKTGTIVSIRNLQRRHFKPLLVKAKVPDIRLYDLRHTCATLLLAAGENPKVVSERLGHASIVLTLDTYSHVLPTMQKSATERLEKLLRKCISTSIG
jgi:integrase